MLLETLAVTAGKPNARSVGKVISVPEPTTALMAPAATPARAMATISYQGTGRPYKRGRREPTTGPGGTASSNSIAATAHVVLCAVAAIVRTPTVSGLSAGRCVRR